MAQCLVFGSFCMSCGQMSGAAEKVQQHPAFREASTRATYYVDQLDKTVSFHRIFSLVGAAADKMTLS